jgi:hypothetical protein
MRRPIGAWPWRMRSTRSAGEAWGFLVDPDPDAPSAARMTSTTCRASPGAELVVTTTAAFMDRWAAGERTWDDGLVAGEVMLPGRGRSGLPRPAPC